MSALPPVCVSHLLIGRAVAYGPNGEPSAIDKHPVAGPLALHITGFAGDQQGDTRHHGGLDKAIHHYPAEHYRAWRNALPELSGERFSVGGFGENISTRGITEQDVCVGDIFALGSATLQVTQARQPCWKLNLRFGSPLMARQVQESGRTGWYYRVLEEGTISPGDLLRLRERPLPDWPLAKLLHYLYSEPLNRGALGTIAGLTPLALSWRELAERRLSSGQVEPWTRRLETPAHTPPIE
ncbi:MAG: MOSC domain-containing protein [Gammaproteobacteria bacterium]|nr:MOSC domain-containing protein [Gammaproteobacteria bacterium]MCW8992145.1 MOSC domain-containing protein [Gammaproteobacteria bacterium]